MQTFTQLHETAEPLKIRTQIYFKKALALELMAENESVEAFGVCLCEKTRIVNNLL